MHNSYIAPGVDGAVLHKQAWARLVDQRSPEETIVHEHKYLNECTPKCKRYHTCITTNEPGSHSITAPCPTKEEKANG